MLCSIYGAFAFFQQFGLVNLSMALESPRCFASALFYALSLQEWLYELIILNALFIEIPRLSFVKCRDIKNSIIYRENFHNY